MNFREEFKKSPIQTSAAAIAIALAVGGAFAGGLTLALPSIHFGAAWFPIYAFGGAIGIFAGVLAALSFRRTWIFGVGSTIGLLFASANVSARIIGFSNLELNGVEVALNGVLCYIGFAGVLLERIYLWAKERGALEGGFDRLYTNGDLHAIMFGLLAPGLVFSGAYVGSLPDALALLLK